MGLELLDTWAAEEGWPAGVEDKLREELTAVGLRHLDADGDQIHAWGREEDAWYRRGAPEFFPDVVQGEEYPRRAALWRIVADVQEWEKASHDQIDKWFAASGRELRYETTEDGYRALVVIEEGGAIAAAFGSGRTKLEAACDAKAHVQADEAATSPPSDNGTPGRKSH